MFALKVALLVVALLGAPIGYIYYNAVLSPNDWRYEGSLQWSDAGVHPAPAPLAGGGLPMMILAGGIYLVTRRLRRPSKRNPT